MNSLKSDPPRKILGVRLLVGELSCIEPEQLRFCYGAITKETAIENSALEIERVEAEVSCPNCSYRGRPKFWEDALSDVVVATLQCPSCGKGRRGCPRARMHHPGPFAMPSKSNAPLDELNREGKSIQELIERITEVPDPSSREMLEECLESLLRFYGKGLARILELVEEAGPEGREVYDRLINDGAVRGLLLIHGLHPVPLETRLREALDKIRPYMESHGGNVELLSLEDDVARLRLQGHCKTCPSSAVTMELAIRGAIEEACPDLMGFEVEGVEPVTADAPMLHVPNAAPAWTEIAEAQRILTRAQWSPFIGSTLP